MDEHDYDLIVLGGGMAGLPMAFRSAYAGLRTALVEAEYLGGTCLNRGCIPTKTMIRSAEIAHLADRASEFGVEIRGEVEVDMASVKNRKDRVLESIRTGTYENAATTDGLDLIEGHGTFESPTEITVDGRTISAETIVVSTGARPAKPPIDGLDAVQTLDSTSALDLTSVPDRLVVVGGGYVGCEYAQMFERFGADVTVFQRPGRLLAGEDPDVSGVIERIFEDEGIDVRTDATVERLADGEDGVVVTATEDGSAISVQASHVLVAAGRQPNTDRLDADAAGIDLDDRGFVEVDDQFRTSVDGIYAIGDVAGGPMYTHSARDDAALLYRHVVDGEAVSTAGRVVPHAVFTDPQVGRVGLTEEQAVEAGHEVAVGRAEYADQGKPKALGETEGFVKLVSDADSGELLGGHVVGEAGADIVHELVIAMELGATARDVADAMHVHPTLPEVINSAAGGVHEPS